MIFFQLLSTHSGAMSVVGIVEGLNPAAFLTGPERGPGLEGGFLVWGPQGLESSC